MWNLKPTHNTINANALTNNVHMSKSALLWVLRGGVHFAGTCIFIPGQNVELPIWTSGHHTVVCHVLSYCIFGMISV